jgi:hypothetical protein
MFRFLDFASLYGTAPGIDRQSQGSEGRDEGAHGFYAETIEGNPEESK